MTKLDESTIQALKLCLDGSNCFRCSLGNGGKAMLTCRELLEKLAEFAGVEIEGAITMTTYTCDRCGHVFEDGEFRHHIESTSESCSNGGKNLSWVLSYANGMGNPNDVYDHRSLDLCADCYKKFLGLLDHKLTILEDDISVTDFVRRFIDIDGNVRIFVWDTSIHDKPYKNIIKELFGESTLSVHKFDAPLYYNTFAKYKFLAVTPCDPIDKFGPTVDIFARGPEDDTDTVCCGFDEDGKARV